uniref:HTH La-type RNA-binding domain-containing protein n=1 Tax=Alexandrium andersonii TaxID=327968 RepID=A0A7S2N1G8_9DINO|mmetsp:Transcript_81214/g.181719  ORF Transcript_81214/g.181719 Transcript_81214/m.181719 type:complete len:779 (+) Transcript_81214:139-2475(+)
MATRRSGAKAPGKPSTKPKWVPRGEAEAEVAAPVEAEEKEEEVITSPILLAPSVGPSYGRLQMLRAFELAHGTEGAAAPAAAAPASPSQPTEEQGQGAAADDLRIGIGERPTEEPEVAKQPGARRAMREMKKAQKLARRSSSGLQDPDAEETPSADVQTIALSQELQPEAAQGSMPPMDAALMAYLSSMAWGMPPMPPMYGGVMGGYTTVMLRNIPNRYTRDMLIERLNKGYDQQYDFVYLPIDFNSKCNVGYAFINFRQPVVAQRFMSEFHGAKTKHCLPGFSSAKVCEVTYARVQGRDANMDNLKDEKFIEKLTEKPEWQPLFYDDRGKEIDFAKTLVGSGKKRTSRSNSGSLPAGAPPPPPGGYMMPPPYGPMMYPPFPPPFGVPPCTLGGVLPSATSETAMMLRGVPTSCTRQNVVDVLAKEYKGAFDFLFLPGDPRSEANRGFLFLNFRTAKKAQQFMQEFNGAKVFDKFPEQGEGDDRLCEVQSARLPSIEKSIERVQSAVAGKGGSKGKDAWLPLLFAPDGEAAPFPLLAPPTSFGGPMAAGPSRPVKAADSRTIEMKMNMEAKGTTPTTPSEGSGKGRGKGKKGKDKMSAAFGPMGFPGAFPPGYLPPYGYPPYSPAQQTAAVARMSAAVQRAHLNAQAAAAAHAGYHEPPTPAAVVRVEGQPLPDEKKAALRKQIEFYFSPGNLCKDMYLRGHMDTNGWTPLELIARFPRVEKYKASMTEITEVMADSAILEVDSATHNVRLKDEEERGKWAVKAAAEAPAKEEAAKSS